MSNSSYENICVINWTQSDFSLLIFRLSGDKSELKAYQTNWRRKNASWTRLQSNYWQIEFALTEANRRTSTIQLSGIIHSFSKGSWSNDGRKTFYFKNFVDHLNPGIRSDLFETEQSPVCWSNTILFVFQNTNGAVETRTVLDPSRLYQKILVYQSPA